jgi:hypothetical protein
MSWFNWVRRQPSPQIRVIPNARVAELAAKLDLYVKLPTTLGLFGPKQHTDQLRAPLGIAELQRFESEFDVSLPTDYLDFLTFVSNGGPGPHNGLYPLDAAVTVLCEKSRAFLSAPFPLTEAFTPFDDQPDFDELSDEAYWQLIRGSIVLANHGCGRYDRLVISGPQKGQVWTDAAFDHGLYPVGQDFYEWYDSWLVTMI